MPQDMGLWCPDHCCDWETNQKFSPHDICAPHVREAILSSYTVQEWSTALSLLLSSTHKSILVLFTPATFLLTFDPTVYYAQKVNVGMSSI
jgi:hypothetical protein